MNRDMKLWTDFFILFTQTTPSPADQHLNSLEIKWVHRVLLNKSIVDGGVSFWCDCWCSACSRQEWLGLSQNSGASLPVCKSLHAVFDWELQCCQSGVRFTAWRFVGRSMQKHRSSQGFWRKNKLSSTSCLSLFFFFFFRCLVLSWTTGPSVRARFCMFWETTNCTASKRRKLRNCLESQSGITLTYQLLDGRLLWQTVTDLQPWTRFQALRAELICFIVMAL